MSAEFIKMISELHEERFYIHLERMIRERTPCGIFFGFIMIPGNAAENIQVLLKAGLSVTCAIVLVEAQAKALRKLSEVPVITFEDFSHFGEKNFPDKPREVFFVDTIKDIAFASYLKNYGIESLAPSRWNKQNKYFSFMMKHLSELYSVYEMMGGAESKRVMCAAIKGSLTDKVSDYRFASEPQYFLEGFYPKAGDITIDGGAYDGGTAIAFARYGAKVYAFEMDASNYKKCWRRLARFAIGYDITLENFGLSDKAGEENYFSSEAFSTKSSKGNLIGKFIDLDTYVERKNLSRVDYIKLDIVGSELAMLRGAARTIARYKPKMAISAYHKPEDLWTLALYVKSLRPDYEFEFRHYKLDCADYFLNDDERNALRYFGMSHLIGTACGKILYCR